MSARNVSLEEGLAYIEAMDLNYIVEYMCSERYPLPRWTLSDAKQCQTLYKNFLTLFKQHPNEGLVPNKHVDEFWHNHILFTKEYIKDCIAIFGHYLHHIPANANDNPEILVQQFLKTKELYFDAFGSDFVLLKKL